MRSFVACSVLLVLLPPLSLHADDARTLRDIDELGGSVSARTGGWAIGFHLRGRALHDDGLVLVRRLGNVVELNLRDTKVTSAGLEQLKDLESLRTLHLERTAIGDDGLEHLVGLKNLRYLNLYGTRVTDEGLEHLRGLENLRSLYLWQTDVTDDGVARLAKALPELAIVRGVDLATIPAELEPPKVPKATVELKWTAVASRDEAPKSANGLNTRIDFENRSGRPVKIYWIDYGNELKLYGTLAPDGKRMQNTYARNSWLITDATDEPLGYFVAEEEIGLAVIPKAGS